MDRWVGKQNTDRSMDRWVGKQNTDRSKHQVL